MYADRVITCSNEDGYEIVLTERGFTPFLLCAADGIYDVLIDLTISKNNNTHGSTYQGSRQKERDITLVIKDQTNSAYNRQLVNRVFSEGTEGTLVYKDDEEELYCKYRVEKIKPKVKVGARLTQIDLVCVDPFFYAMDDYKTTLATTVGAFTFPHCFPVAKEVFGYKSNQRLANIKNELGINGIGLTITVTCSGEVTNPIIRHIEANEHIALGSESNPLNLLAYDKLIITTALGDAHIYLVRDGVKTEINQYLTEDSEFIKLQSGNNNIGYDADSGADNMEVEVKYRKKYAGA
jgi:hypothetical protein